MTISMDFTAGNDRYVADTSDSYMLNFRAGDDWLKVMAGTVRATFGYGDDYARVEAGSSTLFGQAGNDRFDQFGGTLDADGGSGNDRFNLFGGSGLMKGQDGDDCFDIRAAGLDLRLDGGAGNDLFLGRHLTGSGFASGGAGNDRFLDFRSGTTVAGGAGNDLYRISGIDSPTVVESAGEGRDTIQLTGGGNYTLAANLEDLVAIDGNPGGERADLFGNELANRIVGSAGSEYLDGGAGNDVLNGGGGDDILFGGDGDDRIAGGAGTDVLYGGLGVDTFVYWTGDAPVTPTGESEYVSYFEAIDRVDVSAIDANTDVAGVQHFSLVQGGGTAVGTLHLIYDEFGAAIVLGYTDSDDVADFTLRIWGDWGPPDISLDNFITG